MAATRLLPDTEAAEIVELARSFARRELAPQVDEAEEAHRFPREIFATMGDLGLLGMPYPVADGGAGLPYETYLQALEEIGGVWASVGVGLSVHVMSCWPLHTFGTEEQRAGFLPGMLGGGQLGAYCLSEADAGSDPAALRTRAVADGRDGYRISGSKAWVTHGGHADFYTVFARTSDDSRRGISCFLVDAGDPGLQAQSPERKMGMTSSPTATISCDGVAVDADRRIGAEGQGLSIALQALDHGRLGIAAVAVGLAQRCLDEAVDYARQRSTFGRRIIDHQGLGFLLADMAAAVESARATMLEAARRHDRGVPFGHQASIAKLVCTDAAMRVATDAVQVLCGVGYTRDFPVERMMRDAKVMQIFEGTNQIQRMVIARHLARG